MVTSKGIELQRGGSQGRYAKSTHRSHAQSGPQCSAILLCRGPGWFALDHAI
jgi:hypothetical protein